MFRANRLSEQITTLTEKIEELKNDKIQILFRLNCHENEVASKVKVLNDMEVSIEKLESQYKSLSAQKEEYKQQFLETKHTISEENQGAVQGERETMRFEQGSKIIKKLVDMYQKRYNYDIFADANEIIDKELQENIIWKKRISVKEYLKGAKHEEPKQKKLRSQERGR